MGVENNISKQRRMKTIREWLNELPEPIRSRAIRNTENESDTLLDTITDVNFKNALWVAFIWSNTPEGHNYWGSVHGGKTPELPEHLKEEE